MILSGKDLVIYYLNKAIKFAMMATGTFAATAFMMLMCIAYC